MGWISATVLATLLFAIYPIFGERAGRVHGERINFICDTLTMLIISIGLAIYKKEDFHRITKTSFAYGLGMGFSGIAFILMLYAWRIAPNKIPIIMVMIGFSTVITPIIYHFLGTKLSFLEWLCILGATFCITMLVSLQRRI